MNDDANKIKRRNYKIMGVAFMVLIVINILSPGHDPKKEQHMGLFSKAPQAGDTDIPEGNHIKIETEYGDILIELYPDTAPNTVANFKALTGKGYYDGLTFHR
ncbi:MAG: peptidylprolyl isomerase, partial [Mariprofundus sp.]|nr:peptidylprolyl isomerase [Mariprofundus sp.]